jgi:hypothetical protein
MFGKTPDQALTAKQPPASAGVARQGRLHWSSTGFDGLDHLDHPTTSTVDVVSNANTNKNAGGIQKGAAPTAAKNKSIDHHAFLHVENHPYASGAFTMDPPHLMDITSLET